MPSFSLATAEEATARSEGADVDLTPYRAAVVELAGQMVGAFSRWGKVVLAAGEKMRTERGRFEAAAKLEGKSIALDGKKGDPILWIRIRPAPKPRAKSQNGSATVIPPPLPAPEPAKAGK